MSADPPPSPLTMLLVAVGLAAVGLFMLGHGLQFYTAEFMRPNPTTPFWVFSVLGVFLLFASVTALGHVVRIPLTLINLAGWSCIALAMLMAHWLLFYAEGAKCGIGFGIFSTRIDNMVCRGLGGAVLGIFDLIFIFVGGTALWRRLK